MTGRYRAAYLWVILGLVTLISSCVAPSVVATLPQLPDQVSSQDLVPQEFLCPGSRAKGTLDPRLVQEIQVFLEENSMLGGIPFGVAADLPVILNGPVQTYLQSFPESKNFQAGMARSGRYLSMTQRIFQEYGLPKDLVYLALIESSFNPLAKLPAEAVGIWQFIEGTARRYGLKVNDRVDERRDPEKSARAAARYLRDLYKQFECWYLAAAGYNAGEKRVERVITRHDIRDFWTMAERKLLPEETCNYVPQFIAAALIAKNPEKYGLTSIKNQKPRGFDLVKVPGGTDLTRFAESLEISKGDLMELNPELKMGSVPLEYEEYMLKIPHRSQRHKG